MRSSACSRTRSVVVSCLQHADRFLIPRVRTCLLSPPLFPLQPELSKEELEEHQKELATLTGCPHPDDEILYAVPMCAPLAAVADYTFKVKLQPGKDSKMRAIQQAVHRFSEITRQDFGVPKPLSSAAEAQRGTAAGSTAAVSSEASQADPAEAEASRRLMLDLLDALKHMEETAAVQTLPSEVEFVWQATGQKKAQSAKNKAKWDKHKQKEAKKAQQKPSATKKKKK